MGKSYGSIRSRLMLCYSCGKPIVGEDYYRVPSTKRLKEYVFHNTAQLCADAQPLAKDWYRQNDRTKAHNRTQTRLHTGDGYSRDINDNMPMWLRDMEFEDSI